MPRSPLRLRLPARVACHAYASHARCPPPQESISWTCSSTTSSSTCALPSSSCPAHSNGVSRCAERAKHVHEFRPSRARALHVHELCLENDHVAHENDDRAQVSIQQLSKSVLTICARALKAFEACPGSVARLVTQMPARLADPSLMAMRSGQPGGLFCVPEDLDITRLGPRGASGSIQCL